MPVEAYAIDQSFKFFGLEPSASLTAIREAYRRYVKEFHPDCFPAGSEAQKLAAEKMIAANKHYEELKAWFEEYPDGKPPDEGERQEPHDDNDWESWEKQRRGAFDEELKAWVERQAAAEKEKTRARELARRQKLVTNCKVGLIIATAAMWLGWFSENGKLERQAHEQAYQDSVLNQNYGGDPIHAQWMQHVDRYREHPQDRLNEQPEKIVLLGLWSAGVGWLFLSKKGKSMVDTYLAEAGK